MERLVCKVPEVDTGRGVITLAPIEIDIGGIAAQADIVILYASFLVICDQSCHVIYVVGILLTIERPYAKSGLCDCFSCLFIPVISAERTIVAQIYGNIEIIDRLVQSQRLLVLFRNLVVDVRQSGQSQNYRVRSHRAAGVSVKDDAVAVDLRILLKNRLHGIHVVQYVVVTLKITQVYAIAGTVMNVDNDRTLANPGGCGCIVHDAGAEVVGSIRKLPVGDALTLQGKYYGNGFQLIVIIRYVDPALDVIVAAAVRCGCGGTGNIDAGLFESDEAAFAEVMVDGRKPEAFFIINTVLVYQGGPFLLCRVTESQIQALSGLIALI